MSTLRSQRCALDSLGPGNKRIYDSLPLAQIAFGNFFYPQNVSRNSIHCLKNWDCILSRFGYPAYLEYC